jgi:hypothetical protein
VQYQPKRNKTIQHYRASTQKSFLNIFTCRATFLLDTAFKYSRVSPHHPLENSEKPQQGRVAALPKSGGCFVLSRLDKPTDFSALLEKYADCPLFSRSASNIDRDRSNSTPSQNEVIRARLSSRFRTAYHDRIRTYALRDSEIFTLTEVGKFRVIATDDLRRFAYDGNKARLEQDVQSLRKQGLISRREIEARNQPKFHVLSLTKDGKRFLERQNRVPKSQALYAGFVKPKELAHDAELYRLYQKVASEIERSGGTVRRVVLDYELKEELYRVLSKLDPADAGSAEAAGV